MGDSSECFSANTSHLSLPTDIKFMDNVSDSDEDEAVKKSTFSSGSKNYVNGDLNSTSRDVCIEIGDLNAPVPICPDTDASCLDTNGLEENCAIEPKISSSEALGREANGFDEAAEVEGSEEEVRTGSPTGSSDRWAEDNFSDDDSNYGLDRDAPATRRTQMLFSHDSMTSACNVPYQQFKSDIYSSKSRIFSTNGSSSPHQVLYSGIELQEYTGRGENSSLYNYPPPMDSDKPLRTTDTYKASASSHRPPSCKSEIDETVSFKLHPSSSLSYSPGYAHRQPASPRTDSFGSLSPRTSMQCNLRTPLPSSCSPSISGSSVRTVLPYETPTSPPLGNPVDESKVRRSAVGLLSPQGISSQAQRGMPRSELIPFDENEFDASCNEVEAAKKKKKKKKRSGNKSGDVVEPEKKQGKSLPPSGVSTVDKAVTDTVQESRAQQYPPPNDVGSSVMENPHRSKAKLSGKNKKKAEVKSYSAKEIDGNRGCESIESLLNFVEGKKVKATGVTASSESRKKQKKQKVVTRTVANSASFEQGKSTPLVMGSVVEEAVVVTAEEAKLCIDSSTISTSDSGLISIDGSGGDSLVSPKVDGSGDQSAVLEDTSEITPNPTESNCANDKVKQTDASSPSDPVTELETKKMENDVKVKAPRPYLTEPSPPPVADLEFTNFEGLVDQYTEQPFEKYVGRKKKQRQQQQQQPTQQFRQGYATNSSFGHTRGRWPTTNQPNNVHVNSANRVHGNGLSHSSQTPHSQAGATNKLPANQPVGRYPATSTPQSFASKASSSRSPQQMPNDQQRKSTGSAASSAASPPPPREEFPPLRPSADAKTLKKEISPSTSVSTSTSSPAPPSKNSGSVSSSGGSAAPSEPRTADCRSAAPSGNYKHFDRVDVLKIQQFLEMLYPKQNETCYFYSENAKRYHFLKMSAKDH